MLRKTKVWLQLISDCDMLLFVVSWYQYTVAAKRLATASKAKNPYTVLSMHDKSKLNNYIIYLDANNLPSLTLRKR